MKLKHVENTYKISIREYYSLTDKELLEIIMPYSTDSFTLPLTSIISKKESGVYNEIRKRYKTYSNFAQIFGYKTKNNFKKSVSI